MKKLNLRTKTQRQYLEIPVDFIDEYMPQAPEGALKVYLYLVRCAMDPTILLSLSDMADLFDITQKTVVRALTYWEECGLLSLEYEEEDLKKDIIAQKMRDKRRAQKEKAEKEAVGSVTG